MKSAAAAFDNFVHKYPDGAIQFINQNGVTYRFGTAAVPINEFSITMPVGAYTLSGHDGNGGTASATGSEEMALIINSQTVNIHDTTTILNVVVTPTCALFLISDGPRNFVSVKLVC